MIVKSIVFSVALLLAAPAATAESKIQQKHDAESAMSNPFSFSEILSIPQFNLQQPSYLSASDGCKLAYYLYDSENPHAVCIFYHGAGLYGNHIHQWIAKELAERHNIATFIADIRGHGNSGGARGDAPSLQAVWDDVNILINQAQSHYPNKPLYLAGHSSGSGLLLNYAAWPQHKEVDGLILLAPYLGPQSGTLKAHTDPSLQFAKRIRTWALALAGMSNGYLGAHIPAIYFNYPFNLLNDPKILQYYTYTMSAATTPYAPKEIFEAITLPTAMLIAADDEQFNAEPLAQYADHLPTSTVRYTEIVPEKHLTILLQAPHLIAKSIVFIDVKTKKRG